MNIRPIKTEDFAEWLPLWESYNTFYKRKVADEITQTSWKRFLNPDEPMFALVAEKDGRLVGLVHYLFHRNTSLINDICYLQDLFAAPEVRGQGIGRKLIEAVYEEAKASGSSRVYWQTQETNETAKSLYNKIADYSGFVVYRKQL